MKNVSRGHTSDSESSQDDYSESSSDRSTTDDPEAENPQKLVSSCSNPFLHVVDYPDQQEHDLPLPLHSQCPLHLKEICAFCRTCDDPLCAACAGAHTGHAVEAIGDFINESFPLTSGLLHLSMLVATAQRSLAATVARMHARHEELFRLKGAVAAERLRMADAGRHRRDDTRLLDQMRRVLSNNAPAAHSTTAGRALAAAMRALDVAPDVAREFQEGEDGLRREVCRYKQLKREAARLRGRVARLSFAAHAPVMRVPARLEDFAALSVAARVLGVALPRAATAVGEFSACIGAPDLPFVRQAAARHSCSHLAFEVSAPVPVPLGMEYGAVITAAVSRDGIFAFFDRDTRTLHVADLAHLESGPTIATVSGFSGRTFVALHKATLITGTEYESFVRVMPLSELVGRPALASFERRRVPRIASCFAFTDLAPWTGRVVYVGEARRPVELSLDTFRAEELAGASLVWSVANTSGISLPGARCLFSDVCGNLHALTGDACVQLPGQLVVSLATFLPSASSPCDLASGAWIDFRGKILVRDATEEIRLPVDLSEVQQSLTRIWRNVFLAFEGIKKRWVAFKITVP